MTFEAFQTALSLLDLSIEKFDVDLAVKNANGANVLWFTNRSFKGWADLLEKIIAHLPPDYRAWREIPESVFVSSAAMLTTSTCGSMASLSWSQSPFPVVN